MRILVVGAGAMGANHARAVAHHPETDLVGIVDMDKDKAEILASRYSTECYLGSDAALVNTHIDGVIVATTTSTHVQISRPFIEAGIPVLIEKPIVDNIAETREILEFSRDRGVPITCGFVERFNPAVRTALDMLDEEVKHFMSVRHSPVNSRATASVVYDLLIHDIDAALLFHRKRDEDFTINSVTWRPPASTVDEVADCVMKFGDGSIASLSASRKSQRKIREIRIVTDTHLIEIDLLRVNVTVYRNVTQEVVQAGDTSSYRAVTVVDVPFVRHEGEPLSLQIQHFCSLIRGEVDPEAERETLLLPHVIANAVIELAS